MYNEMLLEQIRTTRELSRRIRKLEITLEKKEQKKQILFCPVCEKLVSKKISVDGIEECNNGCGVKWDALKKINRYEKQAILESWGWI